MYFELFSQQLLPVFIHRQKVHEKHPLVVIYDLVHMPNIDLMGQLNHSIYLHRSCQSDLLKKDMNTASDLQVTDEKLIKLYDLLSLAEISNQSLFIQSSIKVSRSSFFVASSGD